MLGFRMVMEREGLHLTDVACRHRQGRGAPEQAAFPTVVFVRRGCFVREVEGVRTVLEPTVAYCMNVGDEQRYDHPGDDGDDCTSITLEAHLLASVWGGGDVLPIGAIPTSPAVDLEHRLLLAATADQDPHQVVERSLGLVSAALGHSDAERVAAGRPGTARARRTLTDGVREALAADPSRSLGWLAEELAVSPHHLSRVFRAGCGHTISRHRMRVRTRQALERLAGGEEDLSRLAADLEFADHGHLTRVVRRETGRTPSVLRRLLG